MEYIYCGLYTGLSYKNINAIETYSGEEKKILKTMRTKVNFDDMI